MQSYLRQIPAVHEIKNHQVILEVADKFQVSSEKMTQWIQEQTNTLRQEILAEIWQPSNYTIEEEVIHRVKSYAIAWNKYYLKRVLNGTGTILHTNLGRARLSESAIKHVVDVAGNYSNLEYDIGQGKRGSRHQIIEDLIKEVTGAEAAMVVNNNAAAVYLILRALSKQKEVIVSRGELIEIGGSFRVSSIMEESDAILREVGTTNKTHLFDYSHAINEQTSMIMKVHTSNFKIMGFTESVKRDELIPLAKDNHLYFYEDLGSGALFNFTEHKIGTEPEVKEVIKAGADIVSFSGDKLLGGPQAGIIAGKKHIIDKLKNHQLARVLRVDKMTFAALEATLKAYAKGNTEEIPVIRDLLKDEDSLSEIATKLVSELSVFDKWEVDVVRVTSQVGGGTMPEVSLPSYGLAITPKTVSINVLEKKLRENSPSIIGRIVEEKIILDLRTLTESDVIEVIDILKGIHQEL